MDRPYGEDRRALGGSPGLRHPVEIIQETNRLSSGASFRWANRSSSRSQRIRPGMRPLVASSSRTEPAASRSRTSGRRYTGTQGSTATADGERRGRRPDRTRGRLPGEEGGHERTHRRRVLMSGRRHPQLERHRLRPFIRPGTTSVVFVPKRRRRGMRGINTMTSPKSRARKIRPGVVENREVLEGSIGTGSERDSWRRSRRTTGCRSTRLKRLERLPPAGLCGEGPGDQSTAAAAKQPGSEPGRTRGEEQAGVSYRQEGDTLWASGRRLSPVSDLRRGMIFNATLSGRVRNWWCAGRKRHASAGNSSDLFRGHHAFAAPLRCPESSHRHDSVPVFPVDVVGDHAGKLVRSSSGIIT